MNHLRHFPLSLTLLRAIAFGGLFLLLFVRSRTLVSFAVLNLGSIATTQSLEREAHPSQAIALLSFATQLDGQNIVARRGLARWRFREGNFAETVSLLRPVAEALSDDAITRLYLVSSLVSLGQFQEAYQEIQRLGWSCAQAPKNFRTLVLRICIETAEQLVASGAPEQAKLLYQQMVLLDEKALWPKVRLLQLVDEAVPTCPGYALANSATAI